MFEKPSTRTLVSFAAGIQALGGFPLVLQSDALQWKRGETIADMARVMTRYVHAVMIRARRHADVAGIRPAHDGPVINGLTEIRASLPGAGGYDDALGTPGPQARRTCAGSRSFFWATSNNMSHSWLLLSGMMGLHFVLACPTGYDPDAEILRRAKQLAMTSGGSLEVVHDPQVAAMNADVLYTDVWTSMGQESEEPKRREVSGPSSSTPPSWRRPTRRRSSCIACPRAGAKRSPTR